MEKIASFTVNHLALLPGVYVSRRDVTPAGDTLTTFDLRLTAPNREPALSGPAIHALEHLGATFLRNDPEWGGRVVYFGPMGCLTGCYLILQGALEPADILPLLRRTFAYAAEAEGPIPGATPRDCGNYSFMDREAARRAAKAYLAVLADPPTRYPEQQKCEQ